MRLPKENNSSTIQGCCVSEDEMKKEIEFAYLTQKLKDLDDDELVTLVNKVLEDRDFEDTYSIIDDIAWENWIRIE